MDEQLYQIVELHPLEGYIQYAGVVGSIGTFLQESELEDGFVGGEFTCVLDGYGDVSDEQFYFYGVKLIEVEQD